MHLGLGSSASSSAAKDAQQNEAKEARRLFRENIRTDWHYPPLPAYLTERDVVVAAAAQADSDRTVVGGFKIHQGTPQELVDQVVPDITGWTERYYGSSDSEDEVDAGASTNRRTREDLSPYMFEGPDTVGTQLSGRAMVRKRKRQMLLAEEMEWNEGLKHFITRRDIWTGAKTLAEIQVINESSTAVSSAAEAYNASEASSPRSSTSQKTETTHQSSGPSTATTSPEPQAMTVSKAPFPTMPDMLIPSMSRLLTKHPVRRKIGPGMYSEIYSKIIAQSRTPAVPINLLHLIRSLVQGWKDEGEWPPKVSAPEPSMARKKAHGIRQSVKAVTRVLKITSGGGDSVAEKKAT